MALEQAGPARVVSSESESLILVDENDQEIGLLSKGEAHDGDGLLHRAFSVFLFDEQGRLLIQQRAPGKRLWPGYWANSCCSHPRAGESLEIATQRRMEEELGVTAELEFIYKFRYQARYEDLGSEHELCSVFLGRTRESELSPNPSEIAQWRFVSLDEADALVADRGAPVAPWFRMEWRALRGKYAEPLACFCPRA
ncbi:isopentenyl-diphosphate Delta-isomerase [Wenzhouxiangella marina]|uniref:Isopentenyl-diphosphate Delta-isomerase n=1 Tax=Wenzhouxiangella marina TaxID=1579979 RepID=A0A0K0XXB0_9GAMM|nr:isopentenyl-diphosphate Delta-isomerase [Wenzhouxiangella marina]AKS42267.1 Isopentenyl-diphosphate Delta-isomerase [Wenzhouxiangella marina]MBB6085960.1 isopentenyl-diphosphate delta-isomerase [Wenzhouxiangella marina]